MPPLQPPQSFVNQIISSGWFIKVWLTEPHSQSHLINNNQRYVSAEPLGFDPCNLLHPPPTLLNIFYLFHHPDYSCTIPHQSISSMTVTVMDLWTWCPCSVWSALSHRLYSITQSHWLCRLHGQTLKVNFLQQFLCKCPVSHYTTGPIGGRARVWLG